MSTKTAKSALLALVVTVSVSLVLAGCGDGGVSRSEASDIVEAAIAGIAEPEPALTRAEVEDIAAAAAVAAVKAAAAPASDAADQAQDGQQPLGDKKAELDERASGPPKSEPAEFTKFFVDQAIDRYEADGLDAALAHYNSADSVDGEWYVFVIGENDEIIGHYDPGRRGLDVNEWVGTDLNGYVFGPEMLSAPEDGKWVTYVYKNPDAGGLGDDPAGEFQLKNAWVVRHDGLLFGSGWYISNDEFTTSLVSEAAEVFRSSGLEGTVAYFADSQNAAAGLRDAMGYYNSTDTVNGTWLAYIAAADGTIVAHDNPQIIGTNIVDLLGPAALQAPEQGAWITEQDNDPQSGGPQSMRVWTASHKGTLLGAGWYESAAG